MKNKGFSLVELIVVIAIMAILVGVAVPVYTSYISKAQKNKDIQMADEIKHALQIEFIAESPENFAGGVVVKLSQTGATVSGGSEADQKFVKDALAKIFGDGWATDLALSYDGWESGTASTVVAQFVGSSFDGNEEDLLGQVQVLADKLTAYVGGNSNVIGGGYGDWMNDLVEEGKLNSADATSYGNAAVLYVAEKMTEKTNEGQKAVDETAFLNAWANVAFDDGASLASVLGEQGGASVAAATYAAYEALVQYADLKNVVVAAQNGGTIGIADAWHQMVAEISLAPDNASTKIIGVGGSIVSYLKTNAADVIKEYYGTADIDAIGTNPAIAKKDAAAYLAAMEAIVESEDALLSNVSNANCYSDGVLLSKLNAYIAVGSVDIEAGELAVIVNGSVNGNADVVTFPLDF